MKLINLNLSLFRQHQDTSIEFSDGTTAIIGPNGAGKTSLIEAIAFVLYGTKALRGKVDEVTTRNHTADGKTLVRLVFEHDGNTYRLERSLSDASLYLGGDAEPICSGSRMVSNKVTEILGMNLEEYNAAYYTEQKGLEFLSGKKGATERERFIVRMLGFDKLENIQTLLRNDRRDLKNEISGREASLGKREDLLVRLKEEKEQFKEAEKEYQEAGKALQSAELQSENLAKDYLREKEKSEKYWNIKQEFLLRESEYKQKEKNIVELKKAVEKIKLKAPAREIDQVKKEISINEKNLAKLGSELDQLKQEKQKKEAELNAGKSQINIQLKKQKDLKKLDVNSNCPLCDQELGESFDKVVHSCDLEIKAANDDLEKLNQELKNLDVKKIKGLKKEEESLLKIKQNLQKEIDLYLSKQKEIIAYEHSVKELEKAQKEYDKIKKEYQIQRDKLKKLAFDESEYTKLKGAYETSSRLVETYRLKRVRLEGEFEKRKALIERTEADIISFDEKSVEFKKAKKELLLLEESDVVLTDFRKYINASIRPQLAELASEFISELTDGRYVSVDLADDFSPSVLEDGEVKAVISGGEEDILNLCVRLALSSMLAERAGHAFSLLVLDEVFGSLDENRRNNVLTLLEKLGNSFDQILVITHLDDIKDAVNNLVYIDYDEGSSEVKISSEGFGIEDYDAVNL